jgi:hypothetical protein
MITSLEERNKVVLDAALNRLAILSRLLSIPEHSPEWVGYLKEAKALIHLVTDNELEGTLGYVWKDEVYCPICWIKIDGETASKNEFVSGLPTNADWIRDIVCVQCNVLLKAKE